MVNTETVVESKKGYKKTKLGWIPEEWEVKKVIDIFSFLRTNSMSRSQLDNDVLNETNIYNIHYGDIHTSYNFELLDISSLDKMPRVIDEKTISSTSVFLKDGDVILADASEDYEGLCDSIEIKNIKNIKLISGLHTFALRDDSCFFANGFRSYVFKHHGVKKSLFRIATGISVLGISRGNLNKVLLPIPPLPEQEKIAKILSTWDTAIETTTELISQLQLRKKGLMQQLLTGKKRLPGFTDEWVEKKLESYFTERKETKQVNLPLLSVGKEGVYPQDDSNKKDTSNLDKSKYKKICVGDIGYNSMRMWQGRSALSNLEGIVSPAYTIVTPKENASSLYFSYLFKLEETIHKFYRNSQGMVSDTWMCKFKDFKIVKFNAPPTIKEQEAIAAVLQTADLQISEQQNKLAALQSQKKGLMQQLLTGKTRVKV